MGVYTVMLPDSKIVERVAEFKSVVIVGCLACANDALGFDMDRPVSRIVFDKDTGKTSESPTLIVEEANRLKNLLEDKGISVSVESLFGVCLLAYDRESEFQELVDRCSHAEAVITLSCAGGTLGLKRVLPRSVKIVPGMKTVGIFQIYKVLDETKEFVKVDKSRSASIRLLSEK